MSKISKYLQEHISGEVVTADAVREHFSRDAGVLKQTPEIVVFPSVTNDIRKVARFCWGLGEQGHHLPLTVRGAGRGDTGASINKGVILSLQTHYNEVFEFDPKQKLVRLQPGALIADVQKILKTYGFRIDVSDTVGTVGGYASSNIVQSSAWVRQLEVILANGEVLQTGPISNRELSKKKGLATLEGEIYRAVDGALGDNAELAGSLAGRGNAAEAMARVKNKKGFDLTPLFLGAQGTLGIISEMIVSVVPLSGETVIMAAGFDNGQDLVNMLPLIQAEGPNVLTVVDAKALEFATNAHGFDFEGLLGLISGGSDGIAAIPKLLLFIEFGTGNAKKDIARANKLSKNLVKQGINTALTSEEVEQEKWHHLKRAASHSGAYDGSKPTIPIVTDITVPVANFGGFYDSYLTLMHDAYVDISLCGSIDASTMKLQVYPRLDLGKLNDRQKVFKMIDDFHRLAVGQGGRMGALYGEGRLYAPYVNAARTIEERDLLKAVKTACDPHNILNPDTVYNEDLKKVAPLLNTSYTLRLATDALPS